MASALTTRWDYRDSYRDDVADEVSRRVAGYHHSARIAAGKAAAPAGGGGSGGGPGGGVSHESALSPGSTSNSPFSQEQVSFAKQYRAASQDHTYTAIRPIAVRIAGQPIRIGVKPKNYRSAGGIRTKGGRGRSKQKAAGVYSLASDHCPAWVKRALAGSPPFVKAIAEGVDVQEDHELLDWLENPNPILSLWAMLYCTAFSLEACGEAIWIMDPVVDEAGQPSMQFWYYPRHWVSPIHGENRPFLGWNLKPPGSTDEIPPVPDELVLRFSFPDPANPLAGHSAVQSQSKAINTDAEIQTAQLASMKNATRPGVVLIAGDMDPHPDLPGSGGRIELTPAQRRQIINSFRAAYRGSLHFGDPIILDRVIQDIRPFLPNPAELDFTGSSELTRNRIMHGIGTNGIIAGQVENANRASAVVAEKGWLSNVVNPLATCISDTLSKKLGARLGNDREKVYVWLEECRVLDPEMRLNEMRFLASQRWLRGREAREAFDLPLDESIPDFPEIMPPGRAGAGAGAGVGASAGAAATAATPRSEI